MQPIPFMTLVAAARERELRRTRATTPSERTRRVRPSVLRSSATGGSRG